MSTYVLVYLHILYCDTVKPLVTHCKACRAFGTGRWLARSWSAKAAEAAVRGRVITPSGPGFTPTLVDTKILGALSGRLTATAAYCMLEEQTGANPGIVFLPCTAPAC